MPVLTRSVIEDIAAVTMIGTWTGYSAPVSFDVSADILKYTSLVHDGNAIHRANGARPVVVPGTLILASLPRFLEGQIPVELPEYKTVLRRIDAVEFLGFVFASEPVAMRYCVQEPRENKLGADVPCEFEVSLVARPGTVMKGSLTLALVQEQKFETMIAAAQRMRRR